MKLPLVVESVVGVNFNPAAPWATVMNVPSAIAVAPSFKNRVPPVIAVIWKFGDEAVSAALGVITRPEVVCVFSMVVALVTPGVCKSAQLTVIVAVAVVPPRPPAISGGRFLNHEAAAGRRAGGGRELQPGGALSHGDEVAIVDRGRAVVEKQGAAGDARDLEIGDGGGVGRVGRDHQSRSGLRILDSRGIGHTGHVQVGVDGDRGRGGCAAQTAGGGVDRLLNHEAAAGRRAGGRRELQPGRASAHRDEVALGDRGRAVVAGTAFRQ